MGWDAISNGELLAKAEAAGFMILITADQNIRFQQNMTGRKISIISLSTNHWDTIRADLERVQQACDDAAPGAYAIVTHPNPPRRRRPRPTLTP